MDEAAIIKRVDSDLKKLVGGDTVNMAEVFNDSKRYRAIADLFWKKNIAAPKKVA